MVIRLDVSFIINQCRNFLTSPIRLWVYSILSFLFTNRHKKEFANKQRKCSLSFLNLWKNVIFSFFLLLLCSSFIAKIEKILCLIWNEWFRTLVTELMVCTYFFQSFGNAVESYCTFSCSFYFFFSSSINLKNPLKSFTYTVDSKTTFVW